MVHAAINGGSVPTGVGNEPAYLGTQTYASQTEVISGLTIGKVYIAVITALKNSGETIAIDISSGADVLWNKLTGDGGIGTISSESRVICFRATATSINLSYGSGTYTKGATVLLDYNTTI